MLSEVDDRMIDERMNMEGIDKEGINKKEESIIPDQMNMHLHAQ